MANSPMRELVQHLCRTASIQDETGRTDQDLLESFIEHRDERAFTALIHRHGSMVWGVCRRLLPHPDAEDAFQATFLVLVRKAGSIRPRALVGNWLYGVAHQTALHVRRTITRRQAREKQVGEMPERTMLPPTSKEVQPALDQELSRLPTIYRAVLILCDLEGRPRSEVARQLDVPEGTVAGRLARARTMLAKRLTQRGITLSSGALAGMLPPNVISADVSRLLVSNTIRASLTTVDLVSPTVIQLSEGVLHAMWISKWKLVVSFVLVLSFLATGVTILTRNLTAKPMQPENSKRDTATVVKAETGKNIPILSLAGHTDRIPSVAYSSDGKWIATASWDGTTRIWDANTAKEIRQLKHPSTDGHNNFQQVAFSSDDTFVVTTKRMPNDKWISIVWNRETGEKIHTFPAEGACFALSPDGRLIACGGYRIIRFYELATGKLVREIKGDEKQLTISTLTFSPDSKTVISIGHPAAPQRGDNIERLTIMPDVMRCWDVATGTERPSALNGLVVGRFGQPIVFSPDGRTVVHASGRAVLLRETATGGERAKWTGHKESLFAFAFAPDGRTLASGSEDGTVRLWDVYSDKELGVLGKEVDPFKGGWVLAVAFSPDGKRLVSSGLDKSVSIWDVSLITNRPRLIEERSSTDLETDWKDLVGDAKVAYAAMVRLISTPKETVPFLGTRLEEAIKLDLQSIEQRIGDLDHEKFQVREEAFKKLCSVGERAIPMLRKALTNKPSAEAKQRLETLLKLLEGPTPTSDTVRVIRAIELLEAIHTPESLQLIEKWAKEPTGIRLTEEAKATINRRTKPSELPKKR